MSWPIPKIATILQELQGFRWATSLDLNMGYYTIRIDPDSQKNMNSCAILGQVLLSNANNEYTRVTWYFSRKDVKPDGIPSVHTQIFR